MWDGELAFLTYAIIELVSSNKSQASYTLLSLVCAILLRIILNLGAKISHTERSQYDIKKKYIYNVFVNIMAYIEILLPDKSVTSNRNNLE